MRLVKMRDVLERFGWNRAALIVMALLLVYRRYMTERPWSVALPEPLFRPLGPGESSAMPSLAADDYTRLIDLTDFSFEVNPLPCASAPAGLLLVVIICSSPGNFNYRRTIRETWGRAANSSRLVFLVGAAQEELSHRVTEESAEHGDIVRGNFFDAYRNMTYKHIMGLKWVTYHCPQARYILKTDDDVVVNSVELRRFLAREIGPWGARDLIACHVLEKTRVQRSFRNKWRVSPSEFSHSYYPTYCAGWAVIYSADVVRRLYVEAQKTPYFWIDDVHVTGVVAERLGIPHTKLGRLELSFAQLHLLTTFHYSPSDGVFLFGPPDLTVLRMNDLWNAIVSE